MVKNRALETVKGALLLEHKGKSLYQSVVKTSKNEAVRNLFLLLSKEEDHHISILSRQYARIIKGKSFDSNELGGVDQADINQVLSKKIVADISGAGYEAAVISAALGFEKNAVSFYSRQADEAETPEEKKIFEWLASWEKTHLTFLAELDSELREKIWFDNQFWPLD